MFHPDQGSQFTSPAFTGILEEAQITISMEGRGRCLDNVLVARRWRSVKYAEVYLNDYGAVPEARSRLAAYFRFYNEERLHQALDYQTPATVWQASPTTPTGSALVATTPATN